MRRFLAVGLVGLAAIGGNSPAVAQFYQQRSSAQPAAVPAFNRIEVNPADGGGRRVFQAPQQTSPPAQPTPGGPSMVPIGSPTTNNAPLQLRDTTPGTPLPVRPNGTTLTPMGDPTPGESR